MRRPALVCIILVVSTLAAYWPVHRAEFANFDDPDYVTNNPDVFRGLTWHGVVWAFTRIHGSNWHPLTWLSHMADCSLFGENAAGHHLVNVGFHVANTLLLFLLLGRMTGAVWRSGFVAALFALHPLHVESVAWIAERKDVLSTFFGLLALWFYIRYVERQKAEGRIQNPSPRTTQHATRCYLLSLCFFALGLMSKPMLLTLPFVMLLLDYWPLGRFNTPTLPRFHAPSLPHSTTPITLLVWEKLPFLALSLASSVVTFWAQKTGGAVVSVQTMPLADRLANASVSYIAYLIKTFWPTKLAAFYPFAAELPGTEAILSTLVLIGLTVLAFATARRAPCLLVGWLWFVGTLVPVIGLVQVGGQAMADRYTYIPLVAFSSPSSGA
jgi:hypothetical protein